ncbi:tetratricopeptide repeat protein [bacterium]|nr:tetratricopeptide repeat protein [bacterium]
MPAMCFQAANLATNLQQRHLALQNLIWLYRANADIVNFRKTIDKILAGENPPYNIGRKILWSQRGVGDISGVTNLVTLMLSSETNIDRIIYITLYGATITKEINEAAINKLIERFPSDGNMYVKIADTYKRYEWYDEEIEYRKKAIDCLTKKSDKINQINRLIDIYLNFNEMDKAENLLSKYKNILANNSASDLNKFKIFIASGRTNDAFNLLISACEKNVSGKNSLIDKLLTFPWQKKEQHIQSATIAENFIETTPEENQSKIPDKTYQLLIKKYVFIETTPPEKVLKLFKRMLSQGEKVSLFPKICKMINSPAEIESLIRNVLSSGVTQSHFYVTAAGICEKKGMSKFACELYFKAWKNTKRYRYAEYALRLAAKTKNNELCEEILDDVVLEYKKGKVPYYVFSNMSDILSGIDFHGKYEKILRSLISEAKGKKRFSLISALFKKYKEKGSIGDIHNMINEYFDKNNMDANTALELSEMLFRIDDERGVKKICDSVEKQMTNSQMIAEHGVLLLIELSMINEKNKSLELAEKWFDDPNVPLHIKDNILGNFEWMGADERLIKLAEKLYSNTPDGSSKKHLAYKLRGLYAEAGDVDKFRKICGELINDPNESLGYMAYQYEKLNLNNEALVLYDRSLERLGADNLKRAGILKSKANLLLKMGDVNSAIECAKQFAVAKPESLDSYILLADIYKRSGNYKEVADELCKAVKIANDDFEYDFIYNKIMDLIQTTDVKLNVSELANSLFEKNRNPQNLLIAAGLYAADDKINNSEKLFKEAIEQTETGKEKVKLYKQWLEIVKKTGDENLTFKTMKDYYNVIDNGNGNGNNVYLAGQIVDFAVNAGNYETAIKEGQKFLKDIKANNGYISYLSRKLANAYLESGDNETAWKTFNAVPYDSLQYPDWDDYMNFAAKVGKEDEALPIIESAYEKSYSLQKVDFISLLFNSYKKLGRKSDMQKMVDDVDAIANNATYNEKSDIADFYVEVGENEKALSILKNVYNDSRRDERNEHFRKIYDIYKKENRLDEALDWVNQQPECAEIDGMKAGILAESGDYDNAIELYSKVMSDKNLRNYRKGFYKKKLIETAVKSGDKEKVVDKLVRKIKKDNSGDLKNELQQSAEIYQLAEMYDDALRNIKRAKEITKNKSEIRKLNDNEADCLAKTGEYDDAVKIYEKILQDDSMKWEEQLAYQNKIAKTYKNAHRSDEAKETAEDIVKTCKEFLREHEYGSRAMNARFALAEAYQNSGDKDEARDTLEKIQKKYKNTSYAKRAEKELKEL